ncbi:MAG: alpha/beta hydrolase [Spirochaetes bacterium]|nr:alpha/beta hydrolase [Spirochaetota bacterium]
MGKNTRIIINAVILAAAMTVAASLALVRFDIPVDNLKRDFANESSRFVTVGGMEVHYRDEGRGFPLVLIHGTAASLHTWDGWAEALTKNFRVIRMDLPAFGLTGASPDRDYTIGAYVRFIDSFLVKLGIPRCHIAGNSLGGLIAWNYALAHPGKVEKLILIDSAGHPHSSIPFIFRLVRLPLGDVLGQYIGPRFLIEQNLREVYGDTSRITPEIVDRYYRLSLRKGNRRAFIDRARTVEDRGSMAKKITGIRIPTLIIWGKEDAWIPLDDAYKFKNEIGGSVLKVYDGAGHIPMEEIPEITARDARRFLLGI